MGLSLEPIVTIRGTHHMWLARFGAKHAKYGDPYTGTLWIERQDGTHAHVFGHASDRVVSRGEIRDLIKALHAEGITRSNWMRKREDGSEHVAEVVRGI
ncbi:MAG: hypothetical protein PF501_09965 [Salinisphaera sp.]|jgi:hypothetical protein|nr:hypothetical protein [Salinisphaera sp.]